MLASKDMNCKVNKGTLRKIKHSGFFTPVGTGTLLGYCVQQGI